MALSKAERDALPDAQFAFPRTRQCPISDEGHVAMAWREVERTQGPSDEERTEARRRILKRAAELGMDTSKWSKLEAMEIESIEAMSLAMPTAEHPNKMKFTGVLTRVDHVSEKAPHGSGGRRVIMTKKAADKALPTLLGMGVNYTEKLDGHDAQKKIGIIDVADVRSDKNGPFIYIEGFIYASDFPDAAARIRADKDVLGFSFECRDIKLADPGADPLAVEDCVFTGAAILRKDKAAFMTTALAARAEGQPQEIEMTKEEMQALLASSLGEALKPTNDAITALGERVGKVEAAATEPGKLAAANMLNMVEPHAKALEACASNMEAAGIGGDETRGHAVGLRKMAAHLRSSGANGTLPSAYPGMYAAAEDKTKAADAEALTKAIEAATKPLVDQLAAQGTQLKDLGTKAFNAAAPAERKTVSAEVIQLLAKGGVSLKDDEKMTIAQVDEVLTKAGVTREDRIETKLKLRAAGAIAS